MATSDPALVAVDWDTTALCGWLLDGSGRILADARAPRGIMQIAGAPALRPGLADAATLVLPGTHSKWVRVAGGRIATFATHMTGKLFAVLPDHSIFGRGADRPDADGEAAFLRGVDAARAGDGVAALLFSTRALALTDGLAPAAALDYLSGLLIGDELRSSLGTPGTPAAPPPLLINEPALCALCVRYARALARFGVEGAGTIPGAAVAGLWRVATAAGIITATKETA